MSAKTMADSVLSRAFEAADELIGKLGCANEPHRVIVSIIGVGCRVTVTRQLDAKSMTETLEIGERGDDFKHYPQGGTAVKSGFAW